MSFPSSASCAVDQILTRMTAYNCFIVSHCIVLYHRLVKTAQNKYSAGVNRYATGIITHVL